MSKEITEEVLRKCGFQESPDFFIPWKEYSIHLPINYIEIANISNSITRLWSVRVENSLHDSIATADIQTIDHFNKLMELMDIGFKLKEE